MAKQRGRSFPFASYLRVAHPHGRAVDLERHEELLNGAADLAQRRSRLRGRFRCSVLLAGGGDGEEVELTPELGVPYALWEAILVKSNGVENLGTPKLKYEIACHTVFLYLLKFVFFFYLRSDKWDVH